MCRDRSVLEIYVLFSQFCHKSKTDIKIKSFFFSMHEREENEKFNIYMNSRRKNKREERHYPKRKCYIESHLSG